MVALLALLFVIVPFVELYVIVQASHVFGVAATLLVLLAVSIFGAWLVKREGVGVWQKAQAKIENAEVPSRELVDGVLILIGGALLLTPGFVTDFLGLLLLLPPVRAAIRAGTTRRLRRRAGIIDVTEVRYR